MFSFSKLFESTYKIYQKGMFYDQEQDSLFSAKLCLLFLNYILKSEIIIYFRPWSKFSKRSLKIKNTK